MVDDKIGTRNRRVEGTRAEQHLDEETEQQEERNLQDDHQAAGHLAFRAESTSRHASTRWTSRWSVPCEANDRKAPPMTPVSRLYEPKSLAAPPPRPVDTKDRSAAGIREKTDPKVSESSSITQYIPSPTQKEYSRSCIASVTITARMPP